MSSISDSSIGLILHFIKRKLMLIGFSETVSVIKNIFGWKSSTFLLTRGRKLTLLGSGKS